jgi:hypothetical protein
LQKFVFGQGDNVKAMPTDIFLSYAHADEGLMNDVRRQLIVFERNGQIRKWYDRQIQLGEDWERRIDSRLRCAKVILLLISPAFIESKYCYNIEMEEALRRHRRKNAVVIPIILRPCAWQKSPIGSLQALPKDGKPITQWSDRDQVCLDVANSVMDIVKKLQRP